MFKTRYLRFPLHNALFSALFISGCAAPVSQPEAKISKPVSVKTVSLIAEEVQQTSTQPATVHAFFQAEIRAKISGYVKDVKADIGDFLESGEELAIIDVPEIQKQREIIEAQIVRSQAEEKRALAGVQLAQANVQSSQAKLEQTESELAKANASLAAMEAEFNRTSDLVQRRSVESRMLDEVRKKRDSEVANKQAMESAIKSAVAEVTVTQAQQTAAEADQQIAAAETFIAKKQLEELQALLAYSTLRAPFAGVVTARSVDPGNLVREASEVGEGEPLFVVSQISRVRVRIPVPEAHAAFVNPGDTVTLNFPSYPEEESIVAPVSRIAGALDASTRTMLVEVLVDNPDGKLLPGMFGQATISIGTKVARNMLPARAVRFDETGNAYVYVVSNDETVSVVEVETGSDNGDSLEIRNGIEAGQQVIDAHLKRFTDGQKVTLLDN